MERNWLKGFHCMSPVILSLRQEQYLKCPHLSWRKIHQFLGFVQYLSKFIPDHSKVNVPLCEVTRKDVDFHWDKFQIESFKELERLCCNTPVSHVVWSNKGTDNPRWLKSLCPRWCAAPGRSTHTIHHVESSSSPNRTMLKLRKRCWQWFSAVRSSTTIYSARKYVWRVITNRYRQSSRNRCCPHWRDSKACDETTALRHQTGIQTREGSSHSSCSQSRKSARINTRYRACRSEHGKLHLHSSRTIQTVSPGYLRRAEWITHTHQQRLVRLEARGSHAVRPYWSDRDTLAVYDGVIYKSQRIVTHSHPYDALQVSDRLTRSVYFLPHLCSIMLWWDIGFHDGRDHHVLDSMSSEHDQGTDASSFVKKSPDTAVCYDSAASYSSILCTMCTMSSWTFDVDEFETIYGSRKMETLIKSNRSCLSATESVSILLWRHKSFKWLLV